MASSSAAASNGRSNSIKTGNHHLNHIFSRNTYMGVDERKIDDGLRVSVFTTRFSRESSKNNILENLNEYFVSSKSVNSNKKVGSGEMRR